MTTAYRTPTERPPARRFREALDASRRADDALAEIVDLLGDHPRLDADPVHRLELMRTIAGLDRRGR